MATDGKKLFLDIETVSLIDTTDEKVIEKRLKTKTGKIRTNRYSENNTIDKMPLYPEFSKVLCVSVGSYQGDGFVTKAIYNDESEADLLREVAIIVDRCNIFIGHNIQAFDIPFLIKRMIVNGVTIPKKRDWRNKKKREMENMVEDTMNMWRFGSRAGNAGLETICNMLGIDDPKAIMSGGEVNVAYWVGKNGGTLSDLFKDQIEKYCTADVIATKEVYERISLSYGI